MAEKSSDTKVERNYKQRMSTPVKIINVILTFITNICFIAYLFYNNFSKNLLASWNYYSMSYSFILIGIFYLLQTIFAFINNYYYIPKIKKSADRLPVVGI